MTTPNKLLQDASATRLVTLDGTRKEKWVSAIDAVNYPVYITPAYYQDQDLNEYVNANGTTITGRDTEFHLVVVDQYRTGNKEAIATVTGLYGSLATASVYEQFQRELELSENKHDVESLYVSGNGGMQQLTLSMETMKDMQGCPDNLEMKIRLETSVDGSKAHKLTLIAHNKTGDTNSMVYGGDYNLKARHTTTINDRTNHYIPTVNRMVENWNTTIIPAMSLMCNEKFSRNLALEIVGRICEDSGIGERHTASIQELFTSTDVRTNDVENSMYRINTTINQYLGDMEGKNELVSKFQAKVAKNVNREFQKLKK